ncbi:MAG: TIGR00269 family protein [Armatimonadetes bacterium]|nr:TIGR00269 family protein [Armatimonadota bacterium]MDW8027090.1 TIGR00269 family protein [Armatimonadota bacterium]
MKRCLWCKQKAVIYMREHRLALCKECYPKWFIRMTERLIKDWQMIEPEDKVLVAVSGGKDSLGLWLALTKLGYQADGLYLDLGISDGEYSTKSKYFALQLSERIQRPLHIVSVAEEMGRPVPDLAFASHRKPCSACGAVKRYLFNKFALEHGYTVIATGHNLDDEAATLMGNVIRWQLEYLARQAPVLPAKEGLVKRIKPFVRFTEKQVALFTILSGIPYIEQECPFSEGAASLFYKDLLNRIEERSPGTKWFFYSQFVERLLPIISESFSEPELKTCMNCGMPTTAEICAVCRIKEKAGKILVELPLMIGRGTEELRNQL